MIEAWRVSATQYPKNLSNNGDVTLFPTVCELSAELNGSWQLTIKQPVLDDGRFKFIEPGGIIKAPSFNGMQYFRILKTELNYSEITAYAYPIFMDVMNWAFITELNIENMSGSDAAKALNKFVPSGVRAIVVSDVTDKKSLNLKNVNLMTAINGDDEDSSSLVNTYHGQIIYDNFVCNVNKTAGSDKGVVFRFGKNLNGITRTVSRERLTTRLFPISKDGYSMTTATPWVDEDQDYTGIAYARSVVLENLELANESESNRNLRLTGGAQAVFLGEALTGNPLSQEDISYDLDIAYLLNSAEYKAAGIAESLSLGDIVTVKDEFFDIDYKAQITNLTYDCIRERVTSATVGQSLKNYFALNSLRTISKDIKSWSIEDVTL